MRNGSILIIEKDESNQAHINSYVDQHSDVSFVIKENIASALIYIDKIDRAHTPLPSLLIVDYRDILLTGDTLFDGLRERNLRGSLPIITLNDTDEKVTIDEAYNQGVASYCIKPMKGLEWHALFTLLIRYWFKEVTLPHLRIPR